MKVRMTRPRSALVSLEATPYYHCISRCVRRAWLCGQDPLTGRCFDHRKAWLVQRIKLLGEVFAIDIAAYAVMSNHYHLVLHIDAARAAAWSPHEVLARWTRLFHGPAPAQRFRQGQVLSAADWQQLAPFIARWRDCLFSLSWFMACLNTTIAWRANREDGCTGHFWQGRFESRALLEETALLSCMAYVDLNPVRAGIADTLHDSDFTSIQDRIRHLQGTHDSAATPPLMPFGPGASDSGAVSRLPYALPDYLELVDWTGRAIRHDKHGFITLAQPRLLSTLRLSEQQWRLLTLAVQSRSQRRLQGLNPLATIENRVPKIFAA